MKNQSNIILKFFALFIVVILFMGLTSCTATTPIAEQSGAQLWGDNCAHCHNLRSPETLNDKKWEIAVTHMRTRANLTSSETEKIIAFLKSSN